MAANQFPCPSCATVLKVDASLAGRMIKCPKCGTTFAAPGGAPQTVPPAAGPKPAPAPKPAAPATGPLPEKTKPLAPAAPAASAPASQQIPTESKPSQASFLSRFPRKIRKLVVQGMFLTIFVILGIYALFFLSSYHAMDRAVAQATGKDSADKTKAKGSDKPSELIVGKWESLDDGKGFVEEYTKEGLIGLTSKGFSFHPVSCYRLIDDETMEIPDPQNAKTPTRKLKFKVTQDTLSITDDKGKTEQYKKSTFVPQPGKCTITGLSLYSEKCLETLKEALGKVDGLSELSINLKERSGACTLRDRGATSAFYDAMAQAGFHGNFQFDESVKLQKFMPFAVLGGDKPPEKVTLRQVHACCPECEKVIAGLFKDCNVTFEGAGPAKTVIIQGKNLVEGQIYQALYKAGFGFLTQREEPEAAAREARRKNLKKGEIQVNGLALNSEKCVETLKKALENIEGLSELSIDQKTRTATAQLRDRVATYVFELTLKEAGFAGDTLAEASVEPPPVLFMPRGILSAGGKGDEVVKLKQVHVCCPEDEKVIREFFKDAKVQFEGEGPTKNVTITGKDLQAYKVKATLAKAGFGAKE